MSRLGLEQVWRAHPAALAVCILVATNCDAEAGRARLTDWQTISSTRYGFQIAYPGSVFQPDARRVDEEGQVLVSRDGRAKLLVGAFENETDTSLSEYRQLILDQNYPGADLDFAPRKGRWFIVSGTQGTTHFYQRVNFTCGGKLINSWALIYPVSERPFYDRVVEAIAPTYSPGAGRTGNCD